VTASENHHPFDIFHPAGIQQRRIPQFEGFDKLIGYSAETKRGQDKKAEHQQDLGRFSTALNPQKQNSDSQHTEANGQGHQEQRDNFLKNKHQNHQEVRGEDRLFVRSAEELLAEKTRAILTRSKGRDYFDFWYMLSKGISLRADYIREKMKWYGKDYRQEDLTEIIAAAKEKDLHNDLARFLPKHYRQTITNLKENILQKIGS